MQIAVKSSNVKHSHANFTPGKQLNLLPIGSVTMQLNELAYVLATACTGEKQYNFDSCTCAES